MLAGSRDVRVNGKKVAETPLLVPSFSSKGFPDVSEIVRITSEYITDYALISAYDIHHGHLKDAPLTFPGLWILDSGGFEAGIVQELSDLHYDTHEPQEWSHDALKAVLGSWTVEVPTVVVSFDHPARRISIEDQIAEALDLFGGRRFGRELLIKPESEDSRRVKADRVIANIDALRSFDVLGFTEKELGHSLFQRVKNLRAIRIALDEAKLPIPIHVFGTLDMVSTPLYFLAGADIFDGLTWLRFAYRDGRAIYMRDLAALDAHLGARINDTDVRARVLWGNLQEIWRLEHSMKKFIKTADYSVFEHHAEFFRKTMELAET